jgi:iron complex outermembrane receptor protein
VDGLEVTGGLRYSWERARSNFAVHYVIPNFLGPGEDYVDDGTQNGSTTFSNVSPTVSLHYEVQKGLAVYARYAKGFKPGGFPSAPDVGTNIPFKAETSDNFELGLKADLFDRRLSANVAIYDIEIKNQQLSTIVISNNLPFASVGNAGKSRSRGAELSVEARPLTGLTLGLNAGYVDAKYVEYVDTAGKDRAGENFPFVPKTTASATVDYETSVGSGWTASAGADYKYVGSILSGTGVDLDLQFPVPSYTQLDLRTELSKDHWRFEGYVDNVTDKYIVLRVWNTFFFPDPPARPFASVAPPRMYGLRATYTF